MTRRAAVSPRIATGKAAESIALDDEDEQAIDRALASVRAGNGISLDEFRALLRQL